MSGSLFVFDIETIPDADALRRAHSFADTLSDENVIKAAKALRMEQSGTDFLKHCYHKVVAISLVMVTANRYEVLSIGDESSTEAELIEKFFAGIDRLTPQLVSWNGSGFDLPVLHYRAMLHGISAARYFESGNNDPSFRYNNYQSRYHSRHLDLMDVLANYSARAYHSLDEIATLLGYPGKIGMSGDKVEPAVAAGKLNEVRDYCETDVANTYLVYLHYQRLAGQLTADGLVQAKERFLKYLESTKKAHLQQFATLAA